MTCESAQHDLAAALLTGTELDPATAAHVAVCPTCAAEQASLRQVVAIMATATAEDVRQPLAAPAGDVLLTRILQAADEERTARRHQQRVRTFVIAAAAAVFVLVAGVAIGSAVFAPPQVITASASTSDLTATASIAEGGAGSALDVAVTGLPYDTDCVIVVHTTDGRSIPIAQWRAEYTGTAHVHGVADAEPGSITSVTLTKPSGDVLLDIPVSA